MLVCVCVRARVCLRACVRLCVVSQLGVAALPIIAHVRLAAAAASLALNFAHRKHDLANTLALLAVFSVAAV